METGVCIAHIGTAVPANDIHAGFIAWAERRIADPHDRRLFARMAARSGIDHRWSVLGDPGSRPAEGDGFYGGPWPTTAQRMAVYARAAPDLAMAAIDDLARGADLSGITHLIVASCTGFTAPGLDQIVADRLNLSPRVERLLVGYMGCYAAIVALRSARHIVRSQPDARVLLLCVELSTLHLQETAAIEPLLAMLQFADGAAAALVCAGDKGLMIDAPFSAALPGTADLIRWDLGDHGFAMHLSGAVPAALADALADPAFLPVRPDEVAHWAIHAGGRSILDSVSRALALPDDALGHSRAVLRAFGNMSSATLLFVLARIHAARRAGPGIALAFGPGLAAEGLLFRSAP